MKIDRSTNQEQGPYILIHIRKKLYENKGENVLKIVDIKTEELDSGDFSEKKEDLDVEEFQTKEKKYKIKEVFNTYHVGAEKVPVQN